MRSTKKVSSGSDAAVVEDGDGDVLHLVDGTCEVEGAGVGGEVGTGEGGVVGGGEIDDDGGIDGGVEGDGEGHRAVVLGDGGISDGEGKGVVVGHGGVAVEVPMAKFADGLFRVTVRISSSSTTRSAATSMVIIAVAWPEPNVAVPDSGIASSDAVPVTV